MPQFRASTPTKTDSLKAVPTTSPILPRSEEEEAVANIPKGPNEEARIEPDSEAAAVEQTETETPGNEIPPSKNDTR